MSLSNETPIRSISDSVDTVFNAALGGWYQLVTVQQPDIMVVPGNGGDEWPPHRHRVIAVQGGVGQIAAGGVRIFSLDPGGAPAQDTSGYFVTHFFAPRGAKIGVRAIDETGLAVANLTYMGPFAPYSCQITIKTTGLVL